MNKGNLRKLNVKKVDGVYVASGRIGAWNQFTYNKKDLPIIPACHRILSCMPVMCITKHIVAHEQTLPKYVLSIGCQAYNVLSIAYASTASRAVASTGN
jgi:hypothetical protein